MTRHPTPPPARPRAPARLAAALVACLLGAGALAQSAGAARQFPADAARGVLVVGAAPAITLDGRPERLSPGARIFDAGGMLALPGRLKDRRLVVNYLREPRGARQVHLVWILTPEEARLPHPASPRRG